MKLIPDALTPDSLQRAGGELARRALSQTLKLAVTGLSGSGKTVFITSLVHQMLRLTFAADLPFLKATAGGRIAGTRILPHPEVQLPAFAYDQHLRNLMRDPPQWPQGTDDISQIRVAIRYQPAGRLARTLGTLKTLHVDIIDYPGEWLLDLALLELDFDQWSKHVWDQCEEEPRRTLSHNWRSFLGSLAPGQPLDEETTERASLLYSNFLHRCKAAGLSQLQPGRFTLPGGLKGSPILRFSPLPPNSRHTHLSLLHATMAGRYDAYRNRVVKRFYQDHFLGFDRQIVLVDLLKALNKGYASFRDMQDALNAVLKSFRYGKRPGLSTAFRARIDKLLFAVTKVDCVAPEQHTRLRQLLHSMIAERDNDVRFQGVATDTLTACAIQSARTVEREHEGRVLHCVRGMPKGHSQEIDIYPGEVPEHVPSPREWLEGRFDFPDFNPPHLYDVRGQGIPHIRLDQALEFLIGDRLT